MRKELLMGFAPCDVAIFEFACDRISRKSPNALGRYIAGMNLSHSNQGALIAVCMIVQDWSWASGIEMLQGAISATAFKRSRAAEARKTGFEAMISTLPPEVADIKDAWETALYLAPVIFQSRNPSLVAAFFGELLEYRDSAYEDFSNALSLIDRVNGW